MSPDRKYNFESVVIEGGDQVGKGDTSCSVISLFEEEGIPVYRLSFPQYSTPFGHLIRRVLTEDCRENIEQRDIEIRGMLFALDRLQTIESILRRPEMYSGIILLDRCPYSNALTIAYGLKMISDFKREDVERLAKLGIIYEDFFIQEFGLDNCVIELIKRSSDWSSSRNGGEDQYESKDVQERATEVYRIYSEIIGDGWRRVYVDNERDYGVNDLVNYPNWRPRSERDAEVMNFIKERIPLDDLKKPQKQTVDRVDVIEIAEDIYGVDIRGMEEVLEFYTALDTNDKNIIYRKGGEIAQHIVQNSHGIDLRNRGVIESMRNIFDAYPECLDIIESYYGTKFRENIQRAING